MRPRLKDIAEKTGFSINTVSLALRRSERVPEKTREVVLETATMLNYVSNEVARSLVEKKTRTVGLILTDIMNPILTAVAQHVERRLMAHGYAMVLMTTNKQTTQEVHALSVLRARQVDGILLYPVLREHLDHIRVLRETNYPILLLAGDDNAPYDTVMVDSALGAYRATAHLARLGHRHIAFLGGGTNDKLHGYRSALAAWELPYEPARVVDPEGFSYLHGYRSTERLFQQKPPPSALLASMDALALGALRWCRENGLRVPQDVALVGFDDTEAGRFAEVPLTSVTYPAEFVSDKAVSHLLTFIEKTNEPSSSTTPLRVVIEPELVVRESCGAKNPIGFQDDSRGGWSGSG